MSTHHDESTCTYTAGRWFCPHDCDDPTHGRHGRHRVLYHGHYYRPGGLISMEDL